jgi:ABC-type glycerol-3-phosphate transport system permease component
MVDTLPAPSVSTSASMPTAGATQRKYSFVQAAMYALLITFAIVAIIPFFWMISTSLMTHNETIQRQWLPTDPQFGNYAQAWSDAQFGKYFLNSVVVSITTTVGMLFTSILAGYAFAKIQFFGRNVLFTLLLITLMIPESVTMVPNFLMIKGQVLPLPQLNDWLFVLIVILLILPFLDAMLPTTNHQFAFRAVSVIGILIYIGWFFLREPLKEPLISFGETDWSNNIEALTVPFMASAFSIFMLRQFFIQIPNELWEAARIDGCGHLRFLITIVMPISKPAILTVTLLTFIGAWNALLWPLIVTTSEAWRPLMVGLYNFTTESGTMTHLLMAGSFITILPMLILYFMAQRTFTEGIATSGLKG